jgi:polyferredoxin
MCARVVVVTTTYVRLCVVFCMCVCVFSQLPIVAIMGKKKRKKNDEGGEGGEKKERKAGKTNLIFFLVC